MLRLAAIASTLFVGSTLALGAAPASTAPAPAAYDPVTQDVSVDAAAPLSSAELKIPLGGTRVNGYLYLAQGKGPHPLVVLLHGYPGNERNLDLAQALRRAGYDALYFNYRGSWGSGGAFSFANARADVAGVLAWARSEAVSKQYGIDPSRVFLFGHSMGGWLALAGAADDKALSCVIAFAPWNIGKAGSLQAGDPAQREAFLAEARAYTDSEAGPLHGVTAQALSDEAIAHQKDWDIATFAPAVAAKHGLVVGSTQDFKRSAAMPTAAFEAALHAANAGDWTFRAFDDDHGLSSHRLAFEHLVIEWLGAHCGAAH